jgi:hypothetical protein
MLRPALIGGMLLGMLSALPIINLFNCFCCAWVIGGGMLASYLYVKSAPVAVTLGGGVALGLLTGVIGSVVNVLFTIPLQFLLRRLGVNPLKDIQEVLEQLPNMPPESKEALRGILSQESGGGILVLIIGGIFTLVLYSIVAMLGGALGVAIFEKRKPGETAGGPPPPPPPSAFQPPLNFPPPPPPPPPPT